MTLTITYTLVPFTRSVSGRLHPGVPRHSGARAAALADAERLAQFYAGVIVLKNRSDAERCIVLEPLLICIVGEVPDDLLTNLPLNSMRLDPGLRCAQPGSSAMDHAFAFGPEESRI